MLDVLKQATIDAVAKQIDREYGKLDVLVNNTGVSMEKRCRVEPD